MVLRKSQRDGYTLAVIAGVAIGAVAVLIIMNRQRLGFPLAPPRQALPVQNTTRITRDDQGLMTEMVQEKQGSSSGGISINLSNVSVG